VDNAPAHLRGSLRLDAMPTPRPQQSVPRRIAAVGAAAGVLALVLSGCVGTPAPTPTPSPSSPAPIFASDEEALVAAEEAYGRFLEVSTEVTNAGGADPARLDAVAKGQALDDERAAAARFQEQGIRTAGLIGFRTHDLQSVAADGSGVASVTFYVCDDLRELDLLDANGVSLVVEGRVVDVPYTVGVEGSGADSLKVSEKELWTRDNFCLR
jgi:hypothetical protein